jgi:hypothetical protein
MQQVSGVFGFSAKLENHEELKLLKEQTFLLGYGFQSCSGKIEKPHPPSVSGRSLMALNQNHTLALF